MKVSDSPVIYENPLPQLRSRQSAFPFLCKCQDGSLIDSHVNSEAFESVDATSYLSRSRDGGKAWSSPEVMFDKSSFDHSVSDSCKIARLKDGRLIALGYAYHRYNSELPLGNPATGGLLDDFVFFSTSEDNGNTWSDMIPIDRAWGPHAEASAPLTILNDDTWITPITGFPDWNGNISGLMCGRALYSRDNVKTWSSPASTTILG